MMTRAQRSCKNSKSILPYSVANSISVRPYACDDSSRAKKDELFGEMFHVRLSIAIFQFSLF